jgi:hypothetical protein
VRSDLSGLIAKLEELSDLERRASAEKAALYGVGGFGVVDREYVGLGQWLKTFLNNDRVRRALSARAGTPQ